MSQAPHNSLNRQNWSHDGLYIAGKVRSVWLLKPIPEDVRLRCLANELTGLATDGKDLQAIAECLTDGSLRIWYDQFAGKRQSVADFFGAELARRKEDEDDPST